MIRHVTNYNSRQLTCFLTVTSGFQHQGGLCRMNDATGCAATLSAADCCQLRVCLGALYLGHYVRGQSYSYITEIAASQPQTNQRTLAAFLSLM